MSEPVKKRRTTNAERAAARPEPPKKTGRPTSFTLEVQEEIIRRIEDGETLTEVCRSKHLPERWSVYRYAKTDTVFSASLLRARSTWADVAADQILAIADDSSKDWKTRTFRGVTEMVPDREAIDRSKLRIETRWRLMQRFKRETYSDDAAKIPLTDPADAAEAIRQDATVIAPDEPGPKKPVL